MPIERVQIERELDTKTIKRKDATKEFRKLDQLLGHERIISGEIPGAVIPVPATRPEKLVWDMLRRIQVSFQFQYKHEDIVFTEAVENFRPDFVLPDHNIIIEVFGSYWHTLPGQVEKDRFKEAILTLEGWKLVIWWDWEIERNVAGLFQRDIPEILGLEDKTGTPAPYLLDIDEQERAQKAREAGLKSHKRMGIWKYRNPWLRRKTLVRRGFEWRSREFYPRPRHLKIREREFKSYVTPKPAKPYTGRPGYERDVWKSLERENA